MWWHVVYVESPHVARMSSLLEGVSLSPELGEWLDRTILVPGAPSLSAVTTLGDDHVERKESETPLREPIFGSTRVRGWYDVVSRDQGLPY